MKNIKTLIAVFAMLVLSIGVASAVDPSGATVKSSHDYGEYPSASAGNVDVEAGNITFVDLEANMSTYKWVGLFGNVSGNIELGDSDSNIMFTWTADGRVVYASEANSITWSSLAALSDLSLIPAYLKTGVSDNFTTTFAHNDDALDTGIFSGLGNTYYADSKDSSGADVWRTFAYGDGSHVVYAGEVQSGGDSYRGIAADFQMIIPEDGTNADTTATTYYLWAELI